MRTERTIETKFTSAVSFTEHLVLLCKMLEAAEIADIVSVEEYAETTETMAA
jgi:hypothetical protein